MPSNSSYVDETWLEFTFTSSILTTQKQRAWAEQLCYVVPFLGASGYPSYLWLVVWVQYTVIYD